MGNQQSIIQNIQAQVQQQTAAAAGAANAAAAASDQSGAYKQQKRIELNMAKADVVQKQQEYDTLTPDEALKRKTDEGTAEAARIIGQVDLSFNAETRVYNQVLEEIDAIANSPAFRLAQKYKKDLANKYTSVLQENTKIKEHSATNRRRFLDNDPQENVGAMSIDDRVYLLFWFCFLLFVIPISHHIIDGLGAILGDETRRFYIWIAVKIGAFIIADQALRYLA